MPLIADIGNGAKKKQALYDLSATAAVCYVTLIFYKIFFNRAVVLDSLQQESLKLQ